MNKRNSVVKIIFYVELTERDNDFLGEIQEFLKISVTGSILNGLLLNLQIFIQIYVSGN